MVDNAVATPETNQISVDVLRKDGGKLTHSHEWPESVDVPPNVEHIRTGVRRLFVTRLCVYLELNGWLNGRCGPFTERMRSSLQRCTSLHYFPFLSKQSSLTEGRG